MIPGQLAQLGAEDIRVYLSDKAIPFFPPYSDPDQQANIRQMKDWASREFVVRTLFIILLSLTTVSAVEAAPRVDAVCDIRIDSDYGDRPPTIIRDGFTVDLIRRLIRVAPFTMSSLPSYYGIIYSRRIKNVFSIQAIQVRGHRQYLLELSFFVEGSRESDHAVTKIGDIFGDDTNWYEFGKYFHMNLERCEGLAGLSDRL